MPSYSGVYLAEMENVAVTGAISLVSVTAPSTNSIELIRAWITFNSVTSTAIEAGLKRTSTAGTRTAFTALALIPGDGAYGGSAGTNHTVEGTLTAWLHRQFVNYLNGFLYLPVPEERIIVAPSGFLALGLPTAPGASVNISAGMLWGVLG